jgi:hypothetical protein
LRDATTPDTRPDLIDYDTIFDVVALFVEHLGAALSAELADNFVKNRHLVIVFFDYPFHLPSFSCHTFGILFPFSQKHIPKKTSEQNGWWSFGKHRRTSWSCR